MKNKIVMITAALAVMMAMTGIAAANPESLTVVSGPAPVLIPYSDPGSVRTINITLITNLTEEHLIKGTILNAGVFSDDLLFKFSNGSDTSSWLESGTNWNWGVPSNNYQIITMWVKAKPEALQNQLYGINIYDAGGTNGGILEDSQATEFQTSIPEFATVAIPIAAVLGLVFFFQQRKNKKEE